MGGRDPKIRMNDYYIVDCQILFTIKKLQISNTWQLNVSALTILYV